LKNPRFKKTLRNLNRILAIRDLNLKKTSGFVRKTSKNLPVKPVGRKVGEL